MSEQVNHPSHYQKNGKECIDCMVDLFGIVAACQFCIGNAYKYMFRAGNKDGNSYEQDMKKCKWYIAWVAKQIENQEADVVDDYELLKNYATVVKKFMEE